MLNCHILRIILAVIIATLSLNLVCYAKDVYSLFGKMPLSGRVEYNFTNTRDFLADTEEQIVEQDYFDERDENNNGVKYIDQRAKGLINDQNFMETFVRVLAKF